MLLAGSAFANAVAAIHPADPPPTTTIRLYAVPILASLFDLTGIDSLWDWILQGSTARCNCEKYQSAQ
jgi:hypothetical protein